MLYKEEYILRCLAFEVHVTVKWGYILIRSTVCKNDAEPIICTQVTQRTAGQLFSNDHRIQTQRKLLHASNPQHL
jgi:hypothetical protein